MHGPSKNRAALSCWPFASSGAAQTGVSPGRSGRWHVPRSSGCGLVGRSCAEHAPIFSPCAPSTVEGGVWAELCELPSFWGLLTSPPLQVGDSSHGSLPEDAPPGPGPCKLTAFGLQKPSGPVESWDCLEAVSAALAGIYSRDWKPASRVRPYPGKESSPVSALLDLWGGAGEPNLSVLFLGPKAWAGAKRKLTYSTTAQPLAQTACPLPGPQVPSLSNGTVAVN